MQMTWIRMPPREQRTMEVVHQSAHENRTHEPPITVNGQKLKVIDKFAYMGSALSRAVHIDDKTTAGIAKATVAFRRLHTNVMKVYKAGCLQGCVTVKTLHTCMCDPDSIPTSCRVSTFYT